MGGSFSFVACFAIVIHCMARQKQRERMVKGVAFATIKKEETRCNGVIKRVHIVENRPSVQQIFELQEYFASSECGSGWETEAIMYTFKNM